MDRLNALLVLIAVVLDVARAVLELILSVLKSARKSDDR